MIKISDKNNARLKYKDWIMDVYDQSQEMLAQSPVDPAFLELSEDDKIQILLNSDVDLQARLLAYIQKPERTKIIKRLRNAQFERLDRWVKRRIQRNERVKAFAESIKACDTKAASRMLQHASIMECAEMLSCLEIKERKQFLDQFDDEKSDEVNNRIKYVKRKKQNREDIDTNAGSEHGFPRICKECLFKQADWIAELDSDLREGYKTQIHNYQWALLEKKLEEKDRAFRLEWKQLFVKAEHEQRKEILTECSQSDKAILLSLLDRRSRESLLSGYTDSEQKRLKGLVERLTRQRFLDNIYKFPGTNEYSTKKAEGYINKATFDTWESAESLPDSLEVIAAIAMIEERTQLFRKTGRSVFLDETVDERNARLERVCEKISTFYHREFVPRSLEEALLVEAIRGIYALVEIPAVQNRFYEEYTEEEENLTRRMVSDIAAVQKSTNIWNTLLQVENKSDMEKIMSDYKRVFLVDRRTVGTRSRRGFKDNHGYPFKYGLKVFYPGSAFEKKVTEKAQYDHFYQREYLLSTLIPLRYSVDQINSYLKSDGLVAISKNASDPENIMVRHGIYVDEQELADKLKKYHGDMPEEITITGILMRLRYQRVRSIPMKIRVGYLCVLAEYLKTCKLEELLPADYYISYFFRDNGNSERAAEQVVKAIGRKNSNLTEGEKKFKEKLKLLMLSEGDKKKLEPEQASRLEKDYEDFKGQFREYYDIPSSKLPGDISPEMSEMAKKICFFAAISFSIMTGQQYDGILRKNDELKTAREELIAYNEELERYLLTIWYYFLHEKSAVAVLGKCFKSPPPTGQTSNTHMRMELTDIESIQRKLFAIWKNK